MAFYSPVVNYHQIFFLFSLSNGGCFCICHSVYKQRSAVINCHLLSYSFCNIPLGFYLQSIRRSNDNRGNLGACPSVERLRPPEQSSCGLRRTAQRVRQTVCVAASSRRLALLLIGIPDLGVVDITTQLERFTAADTDPRLLY